MLCRNKRSCFFGWGVHYSRLRFSPTGSDLDHGCTFQYGGHFQRVTTAGMKYWIMEVLFLVLRFESMMIAPLFRLAMDSDQDQQDVLV